MGTWDVAGHMSVLTGAEAGEVENNFLTTYGSVVRWKGPLGVRRFLNSRTSAPPDWGPDRLHFGQEDRLWIADPKALFHILHSSDLWVKSATSRELVAVLQDRGLVWAEGDVHKRQKKALTPAFGVSESKALMPCFLSVANKVCEDHRRLPTFLRSLMNFNFPILFRTQLADKWKDIIVNETSGSSHTLDMPTWMSKATLDA
jgi:cytochrome P450